MQYIRYMNFARSQWSLWIVALVVTLSVLAIRYWETATVLFHQWETNRRWGESTRSQYATRLLQQPIRTASYEAAPLSSILFDTVRQRPPDAPLVFQIHEKALASTPVTIQFPDQTNLEQALSRLFAATKCDYRTYDLPGDASLLTIELERPGARERVGVLDNSTWPPEERVVVEKSHICKPHCAICSPRPREVIPRTGR